jgi:ribosome biogenesis GTPase
MTPEGEQLDGTYSSKSLDLVVGDLVEFERQPSQIVVKSLLPRKNVLKRSYRDVSKMLASNLDALFLVTAPGAQWNSEFMDRILCAAAHESIPCWVIFNKLDLAPDGCPSELAPYRKMGIPILSMSAKHDPKLEELEEILNQPQHQLIAFSGVSGVGKSTLLNRLVPQAQRETSEVSSKSGQGTQTTTQAYAFLRPKPTGGQTTLIDLPGVQNFGLCHLDMAEVSAGFSDIA